MKGKFRLYILDGEPRGLIYRDLVERMIIEEKLVLPSRLVVDWEEDLNENNEIPLGYHGYLIHTSCIKSEQPVLNLREASPNCIIYATSRNGANHDEDPIHALKFKQAVNRISSSDSQILEHFINASYNLYKKL